MPSQVKPGLNRAATLLAVAAVGALAYTFMPSCSALVDADDTLCFAIADAKDGVVDWPDEEYLEPDYRHRCGIAEYHECDHCDLNPWFSSQDARDYIEGFGLAQGHNWDDLGRADVMTFNAVTKEIDTPLGRTYNAYANIVYANPQGIELDRSKSLENFEYYDSFLKWAPAFVSQKTYRVNGNCNRDCETVFSTQCVIARTVSGPFRNDYIDLYQTFFYDLDAVWRASTIVHEVRHARDQNSHDACVCGNVSACDFRWSSNGANTYELMWLAAYYYTPEDHPFITPARKDRATSLFNMRRQAMFCEKVQWQLGDFRYINEIPEYYVEQVACSEDPDDPLYCLILAN